MAVQPIDTLKQWFQTGDYPTQQQFWDWLDSFRHVSADITINDVEDLANQLNGKATTAQLAALNNTLIIGPGVASYDIPAGTLLTSFWILDDSNPVISVGKAAAGTDIIDNEQLADGELAYDKKVSYRNAGTIYFTGITEDTIVIITTIKR